MNTDKGLLLANYILSLPDFTIEGELPPTYNHMGALLTDCILQAGVNYRTTVLPRVQNILDRYPHAQTTSTFQGTINEYGASKILEWHHPEKPNRLCQVTSFFCYLGVETESDLSFWLLDDDNVNDLRQLRGIGPKTTDYMKRLLNLPVIPVDRHIYRFVEEAGIEYDSYLDAQGVVMSAANVLEVHQVLMDRAIWTYMSERHSNQTRLFP